jgi:hypothetical protein
MSIEQGAESAIEPTPNPPPEAGSAFPAPEIQTEQQEPARDWEAEAKDMGWTPKEQWNRRADDWKDAETFVKDGESFTPYVRAYNKKLRDELKAEREDKAARIERLEKMHERSVQEQRKQHEARIAELEKAMRWAAHNGRPEDYDAYNQELKQVQREAPPVPDLEPPAKNPNADTEKAWAEKNAWYGNDPHLTFWANGFSQKLAQDNPNLSFEENLKRVEQEARKEFPHKFKTGANGHAPVDGGGFAPASRNTAFDKMPAEAKAHFRRDVASGSFKDTPSDRERWAGYYNEK